MKVLVSLPNCRKNGRAVGGAADISVGCEVHRPRRYTSVSAKHAPTTDERDKCCHRDMIRRIGPPAIRDAAPANAKE